MSDNHENIQKLLAELETLRRSLADCDNLKAKFDSDREAYLRLSRRSELILDIAFDGFAVVDLEGAVLEANRAFCGMLGYSADELKGKNIRDLQIDFDLGKIAGIIEKVITTGNDRFEAAYRRKDGGVIDIDISANFYQGEKEQLCFLYIRDLTARKQADKARLEEEEKYRTLVEVFPHTITIFQDGKVAFANRAAVKTVGPPGCDNIIGMDVLVPVPESEKQRLQDYMRRRTQGDPTVPQIYRTELIKGDGTRFPAEIIGTRITYRGRPATQMVAIDITEQVKAEQALRESENKYRTLVEQINAVTYAALPGSESPTVYCSPQIEPLIGFTAEEMLADQALWYKRLHPDDKDRVSSEIERCYDSGEPLSIEYRMISKDGGIIWIKDEAIVTPARDGVPGIVHGVMLDISRLKETEDKLKSSEKRYRDLFENLTSGYILCEIVTDAAGNACDFVILEANKSFGKAVGKSTTEMAGKRGGEVFPLAHDIGIIEICDKVAKTGIPYNFEYKSRTVDRLWDTSIFSANPGQFAVVFTDITERRQAQEQLQKSQEAYRDMVENINDAIYTADENGVITYISPVVQKILGYEPYELIGRFYESLIYPEDLPNIREAYKILMSGVLYPSEYRVVTKSGEPRWVRTSSRPIIENGAIVGIRGVLVDISERKSVELALRENEEFNRAAIEHSPLGVSVRHRTGKLLSCNLAWKKIWNKTDAETEELLAAVPDGLSFDRRDDYLKEWQPAIREIYERGGYLHMPEVKLLYNFDGGPHWVSQYFYAIKDKSGRVDRVVIMTEDITERKRAEEALRESEERYRAIWENSPVGICLTDREGVYHYVNKTYCDIYGYSREELIGRPFQEMILPPDHPKTQKGVYAKLFDSPEPVSLSETELFVRKDGKPIYVQYTSDFVRQNGTVKYLVAMNIDITEKKRTIDALQKSEESYRLLVENAGEVIANLDRDGKFLLVNRAAARFFHGAPADFIGKTLWDVFPYEGKEMYQTGILTVMKTGKAFVKEAQYTIRGELKWFRTNLQPIQDSSGRTESVLIISTDINKQKEVEVRAQARLKLLQNLRLAQSVDECLKFGCQAICDARLYQRAVLTLHNDERVIVNLGQVGLDEAIITAARKAPAPDKEVAARITDQKFGISRSFFIPAETGLASKVGERYVPQQEITHDGANTWQTGDELFTPIMNKENNYEGWLSVDTPFNGRRPSEETVIYLEEILDITAKQVHELQSQEMLRLESQALHEKNITLRQILTYIEEDKMEVRQKIGAMVSQILIPALDKLIKRDGSINTTYYNILKSGLPELISASGAVIDYYPKLSPREREICNMIKGGATSKEIAACLNISLATVRKHRELIRRKLGLTNKDINLLTHLGGP